MSKKASNVVQKRDIKIPLSAVLIFGLLILLTVYYLGLMQTPPNGTKTPPPSNQILE